MQIPKALLSFFTVLALASVAAAGSISKPYTFRNGGTADATEVNANFDALYQQTNINSADIATAVKTFGTRRVIDSHPYNADSYLASKMAEAYCESGETLVGATCSCGNIDFNPTSTNFGLVWRCELIGNGVAGLCGTNALTLSSTRFGPPITVTAICASVTLVGGSALAKGVSADEGVDSYQAEREAAVERMKKEQAEFFQLVEEAKSR